MKALIVEDDAVSRKVMQGILSQYCECHTAEDGGKAVEAFSSAWDKDDPFDVVCMDIMMPNMDGHEALARIRSIERDRGTPPERVVKVIVTTSVDDPHNVVRALYRGGATAYIVKPVEKDRLLEEMERIGLVR